MNLHEIFLVACAVAAVAAAFDWQSRTIPNTLTLGVLLVAPLAHGVAHGASAGSGDAGRYVLGSLVGAFACALVPALLAAKGVVGAGDLKLFACLGAILGARIGIEAEFYAFAVAAFVGLALLPSDGRLLGSFRDVAVLAARPRAAVERRRLVEHLTRRFVMGPSVLVGVALTAWLHWRAV